MSMNKNCFAIFPFEHIYEMRFEHTYKPALKAAGLDVKTARSSGVDKITVYIEEQIRDSLICFADISESNENVWYEVGYARACNKLVVMVCDEDKRSLRNLPFDIKDMRVISYKGRLIGAGIKTNGEKLRGDIIEDAKIKMEKAERNNLSNEDIFILREILKYCLPSGKMTANRGVSKEFLKYKVIPHIEAFRINISTEKLYTEGYLDDCSVKSEFNFRDMLPGYIPTPKAEEFKKNNPDLF